MLSADRIEDLFPPKTHSDDINEQFAALRQHVIERHQCKECRRRIHKITNLVQVVLLEKKAAMEAKSVLYER